MSLLPSELNPLTYFERNLALFEIFLPISFCDICGDVSGESKFLLSLLTFSRNGYPAGKRDTIRLSKFFSLFHNSLFSFSLLCDLFLLFPIFINNYILVTIAILSRCDLSGTKKTND